MGLGYVVEGQDAPAEVEEEVCAEGDEDPEGELWLVVGRLAVGYSGGVVMVLLRLWDGDGFGGGGRWEDESRGLGEKVKGDLPRARSQSGPSRGWE